MGNNISVSNDINLITSHVTVLTVANFNKSRNKLLPTSRAYASPRNQILNLDSNKNIDRLLLNGKLNTSSKHLAIIFCNSYYKTKYDLGDSAINDGLLCHEKFQTHEYDTIIFYDSTSKVFKDILTASVSQPFDKLVIYFIGHGTQIRDKNGDEQDGKDECLVFKDALVIDDDISDIVTKNKLCKRLTLMADCCHSGTIFDIEPRDDIITFSACNDNQTAKQDYIDHKGNGIFTYYFWKYFPECNNNSDTLRKKMNIKLRPYSQQCILNKQTTTLL